MNFDRPQKLSLPWALLAALLGFPHATSAQIECISTLQHDSLTPAGSSRPLAATADGRFVVVRSSAPNLVAGQELPTCGEDLYWLDTQTGAKALITHRPGEPNRCSGAGQLVFGATISSDGRFVAFDSPSAALLAPGLDTNGLRDVFLFDQQTGLNKLVTRRADDPSRPVSLGGSPALLSSSGDFLVFTACGLASELVPSVTDPDLGCDVFVLDRTADTISLLTHRAGDVTTAANGSSVVNFVTADARYLTFRSTATDLVAGGSVGPLSQIYLYDRQDTSARLISHQAGQPSVGADAPTFNVDGVSADGRFVAFSSEATNLVPGQVDENFADDVFLADLVAGTTTLVSGVNQSPTTTADAGSSGSRLSPDGRFLVFGSEAGNLSSLWADDFFGDPDVFLFDRQSSSLQLVSRSVASATTMMGGVQPLSITDDGASVTFTGFPKVWSFDRTSGDLSVRFPTAANPIVTALNSLVFSWQEAALAGPGDENGLSDVFHLDAAADSPDLLTLAAAPSPRTTAGGASYSAALTPDARFVLFSSTADFLLEDDDNQRADGFVLDRRTRGLTRIGPGGTEVYGVAITPSGRHSLLEIDGQIHLHDRTLGQTRLISHQAGQPLVPSAERSTGFGLSDDGRFVLFASGGQDLVAGFIDQNFGLELFLYDVVAGQAQLVSRAAGLPTTTGNAGIELGLGNPQALSPGFRPSLTPDGRFILFSSWASNHAAGFTDSPDTLDAYLFDRTTGQLEPMAVTAADPTRVSQGASLGIDLTPNGRFVVFASTGTDLVAGVTDSANTHDVFVRDRMLGTTQLISHRGDSPTNTGSGTRSIPVALSADARFVLFQSNSPNLLPPPGINPPTAQQNAFLYDRTLGRAELVSRSAADPRVGGNGDSLPVALTPNGRTTLFATAATNLVATPPFGGLYLFDRETQKQTWAGTGTVAGFSADGNTVAFTAQAPNLVPNDTNLTSDAFIYSTEIFVDGFESGSTAAWSVVTP
jgi:Tol biopolymer transport system component